MGIFRILKKGPGLGGTFLSLYFKLTWLGLASLREGPAAVPAYGGCSLTAYCTVNPVTVTGLSMPLPPHLCEAKRKQGCGGWERKLWHNTWSSPTNKKEEVYCAGSLALPAWLGRRVRPYGHRIRPGILDMGRSDVTAKSGLRARGS